MDEEILVYDGMELFNGLGGLLGSILGVSILSMSKYLASALEVLLLRCYVKK